MDPIKRFYVGLAILVLLIVLFIGYIGYNITHSDTYQGIKDYDIKYESCMSNCNIPSVMETQEECEKRCVDEFEARKNK